MSTDQPHVINDEAASRFEIRTPEGDAVLSYQRRPGVVNFLHTGVPKELEGHNLGSLLARTALEWARDRHLRVIPSCPFVRAYIARHPEYESLVHQTA